MSTISPEQFLRHIPLFSACEPAQLARLAEGAVERRVERGQILFQPGDACDGMHVLVVGRVKIVLVARNGQEKVLEIINPGQSFGEAILFLGEPYPVMAQAVEDSLVLFLPASRVLPALEADNRLARRMLAGLSMRLRSLLRDVESYTLHSARQRVVSYFLNTLGDAPSGVVTLAVNKQLLASRLNLTPETFSRLLQKLGEEAGLVVDGRDIRVPDTAALRRLLDTL